MSKNKLQGDRAPGDYSPRNAGAKSPEPRSDGDSPGPVREAVTSDGSTSWSPKPKVAAAATTVPLSGLVLWGVEQFGVEMPIYVAGDVAILLAVLVAYLVPER